MNDKAFAKKINHDVKQTKEDFASMGEDQLAGLAKIKKGLVNLGEDSITGLGKKFDQLSDDAKKTKAVVVKSINKGVGQGLSQYNEKVQDVVNRVPGGFGKKVAGYPWVTITLSLAIGLLLGILLKPSRSLVVSTEK